MSKSKGGPKSTMDGLHDMIQLSMKNDIERREALNAAVKLFTEDPEAAMTHIDSIYSLLAGDDWMLPDIKSGALVDVVQALSKIGDYSRAVEIVTKHAWEIGPFFHANVLLEDVLPVVIKAEDLSMAQKIISTARSLIPERDPMHWEPRFFSGGVHPIIKEILAEKKREVELLDAILEARKQAGRLN